MDYECNQPTKHPWEHYFCVQRKSQTTRRSPTGSVCELPARRSGDRRHFAIPEIGGTETSNSRTDPIGRPPTSPSVSTGHSQEARIAECDRVSRRRETARRRQNRRWQQRLGLPPDANPYYDYDPDWIVTVPNMDPWIRPFATEAKLFSG